MSKQSGTKSYPAEFREKAVRLVTERGYTLKQVAEHLECSEESVRRWKEAKWSSALLRSNRTRESGSNGNGGRSTGVPTAHSPSHFCSTMPKKTYE